MKEILLKILDALGLAYWLDVLGLAYWVEIITDNPKCTYYFGPFVRYKDAQEAQGGYIEDLETEDAKGITVNIKRLKADHKHLTVFDNLDDLPAMDRVPVFTS